MKNVIKLQVPLKVEARAILLIKAAKMLMQTEEGIKELSQPVGVENVKRLLNLISALRASGVVLAEEVLKNVYEEEKVA